MSPSKKPSLSDNIRALIKQGLDRTEIAKELNCSYQMVWSVYNNELFKGNIKKRPSKNLKKAHYYLTKAIEEHK
jgi:DNA invertase Pin-like site-specific DNA recombinase